MGDKPIPLVTIRACDHGVAFMCWPCEVRSAVTGGMHVDNGEEADRG